MKLYVVWFNKIPCMLRVLRCFSDKWWGLSQSGAEGIGKIQIKVAVIAFFSKLQ